MIKYKTLEKTDIEIMHKTFLKAFNDYQVKMELPLSKYEDMLMRRGYNPEISMGAFENGELVGFVFNGLRNWDDKLTAYDTGTGVVSEYRKQGITSNLMANIKQLLKSKGIHYYLLEVIKTNTNALELYKKQGFEIVREFECFRLEKNIFEQSEYCSHNIYKKQTCNGSSQFSKLWDFNPSWQNSTDSITIKKDDFYCINVKLANEVIGYGIIDKKTGDIPQIAVHKDYRRRGIAKSIITELINNTDSNKISVLNVNKNSTLAKFLHDLNFEHFIDQYEMMLTL
ncbi:MAG: acetyltransferase, family [Clostridiaceae bacterium]|jgi:ribosomal protein S18 acetylase RimI-like enzyme|nr:acetyltransferase, family [Clostridiaceae bacterium]MDF2948622.1 acetyltransferase, family [Sedimentibacter sp.]